VKRALDLFEKKENKSPYPPTPYLVKVRGDSLICKSYKN